MQGDLQKKLWVVQIYHDETFTVTQLHEYVTVLQKHKISSKQGHSKRQWWESGMQGTVVPWSIGTIWIQMMVLVAVCAFSLLFAFLIDWFLIHD